MGVGVLLKPVGSQPRKAANANLRKLCAPGQALLLFVISPP